MSKAFTKESDDEDELPEIPSESVKNYVTPFGFEQLQAEYRRLINEERPKTVEVVRWAAGNGDRSENGDYIYGKKRLREIDRRIRYLVKRLESAEVVNPALQQSLTKVYFGATVTYAASDGTKNTVKLVGIDEANLSEGKISWTSPVAKTLLKSQVGDTLRLKTPAGLIKSKSSKLNINNPSPIGGLRQKAPNPPSRVRPRLRWVRPLTWVRGDIIYLLCFNSNCFLSAADRCDVLSPFK